MDYNIEDALKIIKHRVKKKHKDECKAYMYEDIDYIIPTESIKHNEKILIKISRIENFFIAILGVLPNFELIWAILHFITRTPLLIRYKSVLDSIVDQSAIVLIYDNKKYIFNDKRLIFEGDKKENVNYNKIIKLQ